MRKHLLITAAALICAGAAGSVLALAADVALLPEPDPTAKTVPPRGPGEDYKSNPARPEVVPRPNQANLSQAERQRIWESMDPTDSPNIRVCVNEDGSGAIQFIRPAEPGAETVRLPPGEREAEMEVINDKEACR
jgi:hypothetical protein